MIKHLRLMVLLSNSFDGPGMWWVLIWFRSSKISFQHVIFWGKSMLRSLALSQKSPSLRHLANLDWYLVILSSIKSLSEIFANRLKMVLLGLIFPGISIGDNALLAQELIHQYHLHKGPPQCALIFDLAKAYDSVEWDFLLTVLHLMNSLPQFCG